MNWTALLQDAGVLDRRVAELAQSGTAPAAAETIVSGFVEAGQTGRLRELAAIHAEAAVREALARLLPPEASPGAAR